MLFLYDVMSFSNVSSSPGESSEVESKVAVAIFVVTFILGLSGNGLVVLVVLGKVNRTVSDVFIMNLAISDITFLILSLAASIPYFMGTLKYSLGYCKFVWPMITVTFFASVFTLCAMAVHRCHGILKPLKANLTVKEATIWAAVLWVLAIIPVIPIMVVTELDHSGKICKEKWSFSSQQYYTVALFLLQYLLPLAIITGAYTQILRRLVHRRVPGTLLDEEGHIIVHCKRKENNQVIKIVAVIVTLFAICMLPHEISGMMMFFGDEVVRKQGVLLYRYSPMLLNIHSCLNPMVYGVLTHQFRKEYQRYLLLLVCCFRYRKVNNILKRGSYNKSRSTQKTTLKQRGQENELKPLSTPTPSKE